VKKVQVIHIAQKSVHEVYPTSGTTIFIIIVVKVRDSVITEVVNTL